MRIAYVVGLYPSVSNTFIRREVQWLRRLGVDTETVSINRSPASELLAATDRDEARRTFTVLPPNWPRLIQAHLLAAITRPRCYGAALTLALRLGRPGVRGRLWSLFYFAEAAVVWRHCRRLGIDHIHVHFLNQASVVSMLAIELEGPRSGTHRWTWSFTTHGPDEFMDMAGHRVHEKARSAVAVACISDFARSQMMAVLDEDEWSKLRVVRCGVDTSEFAPRSARPIRNGSMKVLYVGRMVPEKGQALLIDALTALRESGLDVEATLIGDGELCDRLVRVVRARRLGDVVKLPGAVGQDDIRRYYEEADVFVLPSFAEGLPVVLMEAMAVGLPVVTSRIAGIPELVDDGVNGFVLPPGRLDALVEALRRLASDAQLRRRMGEQGREKVIAEYHIEQSVRLLRDMFAEVSRGKCQGAVTGATER